MIRGAEWADQSLSKARVTRKRIAKERGLADGFAIRAYSELFLSGGFCSSWDGLVESVKDLWSFGMPLGGREKDNRKRKDSRKEMIIISRDFQDSPGYEDPGWLVT